MMREDQELGMICAWMEEGVIQHWMRGKCKGFCVRHLFLFNITQPPSFLDYVLPILQLSLTCQITFLFLLLGFGFAKKDKCAEGGGTAVRDRGAWKDSIGCGRIWGEGFVWAFVGSHVTFPHVFHPTHTQKTPPIPNCHHLYATPTRAQGSCTWSFHSCSEKIGVVTGSPLSSCTRGSRGGYPCPHDTHSPAVGGH